MSEFQVTDEQREELIKAACEIRPQAYAPYSRYQVGAAILCDDERVITGVNVENAVLNLGACAERSAIFTAVGEGVRRILAVAVCTENGGSPCGACRQMISEFAGDIPIYMSDADGNVREATLYELLPDQFGSDFLPD